MNVESEPTMIMPGEIGQIFHAFDKAVTIQGFTTEEEAVCSLVIAGKGTHKPEAPARSTGGFSLPLPAGSFAIALVRNDGKEPRAIKGTWTIEGEAKTKEPDQALVSSFKPELVATVAPPIVEPARAPSCPWKHFETGARCELAADHDGRHTFELASPGELLKSSTPRPLAPSDPWQVPTEAIVKAKEPQELPVIGPSVYQVPNPPGPPGPVTYVQAPSVANVAPQTAGANEVAVILTIGEVARLADVIAEGRMIDQGERWGIVRKLRAAIGKV